MDLLADAPLEALFVFIFLILGGPILLAAFIGFFWYRRLRKKIENKQPLNPQGSPANLADDTASDLQKFDSQSVPAGSVASSPPAITSLNREPAPDAEPIPDNLTLGVLDRKQEYKMEVSDMETSERSPQSGGLAARLERQAAVPQPPAGEQEPQSVPPAVLQPGEPLELLRLLRDPESGGLIVEVAGQRFTRLIDIQDKKIGHYILQLAAHLLAFTNGMIALPTGVKSVYLPKVGLTPEPLAPRPSQLSPETIKSPGVASPSLAGSPVPESVSAPSTEDQDQAAFLAALQSPPPQQPQEKPKGFFGRITTNKEEGGGLLSLNLAEEINRIAQARLAVSPLAATTKLNIVSDPHGGILINVNGTIYHSPDEIPEPEVKALIKESIKDWEES